MKLFLLGATGKTGSEILRIALDRGHDVTAFVRSPRKLAPRERLAIVPGDPLDTAALAAALEGHDAVLSTLGLPPREALRVSTRMTDFAAATVAAMTRASVSRLAILSAAVLFPGEGLIFTFFRTLLRHHAADLRTMEAIVTASDLDWTIARPPRLVLREDAAYRSAVSTLPEKPRAMSFRAVATAMVDAVEKREHLREIVGLAR